MSKIVNLDEALDLIETEDTIVTAGFSVISSTETIFKGLKDKFLEEGTPKNLTLVHSAGISDGKNGIEHLAVEGLITKLVGSHWGNAPKLREMITENKIEAHCLPQGQLTHLIRAMASGKPGIFTKIGLNTFLDPRIEGGIMNEKAAKNGSYMEVLELKDEEYIFYNEVPLNVGIIRGTTADENGNITMENEAIKLEALSIAQAVKRYGGKVIVQVKNLAKTGTLNARDVVVPGIYVDAVVLSENPLEDHKQSSSYYYEPFFTGEIDRPENKFITMPLTERKIIGRRGAMELYDDAVVNLGIGVPGDTVGSVALEEDLLDNITLTVESGTIGGYPEGGPDFGMAKNPQAIIEHPYQFDYYLGTGIDLTFMGAAEIDVTGNVNVSKFGTRAVGCGGFIDITQSAKKVIFLSTFTAKGLEVEVADGELNIKQEGEIKKFVNEVKQITFSGKYANSTNQPVLFVTERAVFQLTDKGLELIEIAPGINLEKDILAQMEFEPIISPNLKTMATELFQEEKVGIKKLITY